MTDHRVHGDEVSGHNAGEGLHGNLVTAFFREHIHLEPRDKVNIMYKSEQYGWAYKQKTQILCSEKKVAMLF